MDGLCLQTGIHGVATTISVNGITEARGMSSQVKAKSTVAAASPPPQKTGSRFFSFRYPLKSLWPRGRNSSKHNKLAINDVVLEETSSGTGTDGGGGSGGADPEEENGVDQRMVSSEEVQNGNWVLKILQVTSIWKGKKEGNVAAVNSGDDVPDCGGGDTEEEVECEGCNCEVGDVEIEIDKDSFSKLLKRVSLSEARLYAKMSYLGNLAYSIPKIKSENLLKRYGLHYVTSSIEQREMSTKAEQGQASGGDKEPEENNSIEKVESNQQNGPRISAAAAYQIAASAASFLHSQTKGILPFKSKSEPDSKMSEGGSWSIEDGDMLMSPEMASLVATTDSVTAVVAAEEEIKQAVADDLSSNRSSPCEWYICDDDYDTRYFVIQGSESLASWKANLLFEPIQFEELDVLVHRGIYEAAKGIYEQMLPEVRAHLKSHGSHATFRFTGHSLGGSLSLLLNLMLLVRGEVPASALLPVITFGAPSIMCGGDNLLRKLGLPRSHVQAIAMHRDIVPRAFCCNYPNHIAQLLKAVNKNFRNHPCLSKQKILYAPMGELLILQPDEKYSPQHHLLPSGSGLYFLNLPVSDTIDAEKQLWAAQTLFLNSPHPLEILSDRSAYGSEGAIRRDHDVNSYVKSVRNVIRQELNQIRKSRREHRRKLWWSILAPNGLDHGVIVGRRVDSVTMVQTQFNFSGIIHTGKESLKRFSRLVASQHMHLLVVLLLPARMLLMEAYGVIKFN